MVFHFHLYGFFDPRRVYGRRPELSLSDPARAGCRDCCSIRNSASSCTRPSSSCAVPGLVGSVAPARDASPSSASCSSCATVVRPPARGRCGAADSIRPRASWFRSFPRWRSALGARLRRDLARGRGAPRGWGLWTGAVGAWDPRARPPRSRRDGAALARGRRGPRNGRGCCRAIVLDDPNRRSLALVWASALAAAGTAGAGRRLGAGLAGATVGLVVAAGIASRLSKARTEGRDAVRVVGRPALGVPGFPDGALGRSGRWPATALAWGPLYEPHRFPTGVVLAERLSLPAGTFSARGRRGRPRRAGRPPVLRLQGPTCGGLAPASFFGWPKAGRRISSFLAPSRPHPVVEGGGAFLIKDIWSFASTFEAARGLIVAEGHERRHEFERADRVGPSAGGGRRARLAHLARRRAGGAIEACQPGRARGVRPPRRALPARRLPALLPLRRTTTRTRTTWPRRSSSRPIGPSAAFAATARSRPGCTGSP